MKKPVPELRVAEFLLVEDNEDDVFLTREAFSESGFKINLHVVNNGVECLQFLRKEGAFSGVPLPDLILLDMHMPVMNGHDVLIEIVKDKNLCHLPVIVLTTSHEASDIANMYGLRCNSYITKPVDFENFTAAVSKLAGYWLTVAVLPESKPPQ